MMDLFAYFFVSWYFFIRDLSVLCLGIFLGYKVVCYVRKRTSGQLKPKRKSPATVMLLLGSGGHTREMLSMAEELDSQRYSKRIYVYTLGDELSKTKAEEFEKSRGGEEDYKILAVRRARNVGQSWISSTKTTWLSLIDSYSLLKSCKPDIILSNGPGTCVPICLALFTLRVLKIATAKIVYVESFCRIEKLSLTGFIVRFFVDEFFVQWPDLAKKYSKVRYVGRLS